MDAGKATISGVFNGSRLLEIPFYQRAYVWGEEQWERFLGDMEFVTASKRPYFLGSIILKQASSGNTWSEVSEVRTVIDGQQRLTTMVIFFKALCAKNGTNNLFERDFVLETGDVALRHGKYDRQDFEKVVSATGCEPLEGSSAIVLAYNYFLKNIDPEKVDRNTIKSNVQFVCIDLTEGEDEQQIFDTINSLGVRLTTAELLDDAGLRLHQIEADGVLGDQGLGPLHLALGDLAAGKCLAHFTTSPMMAASTASSMGRMMNSMSRISL